MGWLLLVLAVVVIGLPCLVLAVGERDALQCPHCGRRGTLYNTEPAPMIWSMECDACGGVTDRHGCPY